MLKSNLINTICRNYVESRISKSEAMDRLTRWNKHFSWGFSSKDLSSIERKAYKQAIIELNN